MIDGCLLVDGSAAMLDSISGQDYSSEFRQITFAVKSLHQGNLVLDGEIVALDEQERTSFQELQNRRTTFPICPRSRCSDCAAVAGHGQLLLQHSGLRHGAQKAAARVMISISTDSHSTGELDLIRCGMDQAAARDFKNHRFLTACRGRNYSGSFDARMNTLSLVLP